MTYYERMAQKAPRSRAVLFGLAIAIGILFAVGERVIFSAALDRSIDLSEPNVLMMNAALTAIPFVLLAKRFSTRILPWLLATLLTGWVHWWFLSMSIAYQRAPDGSGVPMFEAMVFMLSPLPISVLVLLADKLLWRRTHVR